MGAANVPFMLFVVVVPPGADCLTPRPPVVSGHSQTVRLSDLQLIIYTPGRSETVEIRLSLAAAEFLPPAEYLLLCWGGNWLGTWYRNTDHEPCRALDACDDATMPAAGMSDTPAFLGLGHAINGDDVFELALTSGQTIDLIGPTQGCGPVVGVPISVCGEPLPLTGYRMIRNHTVITGDTEWPHAGSASGGQNSNGVCFFDRPNASLSGAAITIVRSPCEIQN